MLEKILEDIENSVFGRNEKKKIGMFMIEDEGYVPLHCILDIIRKHISATDTNVGDKDGWILVDERLPEDDKYILLSFENFSLPMVGRYQPEEDGSGAFYLGDCDEEDTCAANDLFVNAWQPLPEPYRPEVEE